MANTICEKILRTSENCAAEYYGHHRKDQNHPIVYVDKDGDIKETDFGNKYENPIILNGNNTLTVQLHSNDSYGDYDDNAYHSSTFGIKKIKIPSVILDNTEQEEFFFKLIHTAVVKDNIITINRDDINFNKMSDFRKQYKLKYGKILVNIVTNPLHAKFIKAWEEYGTGSNAYSNKSPGGLYFNGQGKTFLNENFVNLYTSDKSPLGFIYMFTEPDDVGKLHKRYIKQKNSTSVAFSISNRNSILRIDLEKSRTWMNNILNNIIIVEDL